MHALIKLFENINYSHHVIKGRTGKRSEVLDSCLELKGGIYIIITDRPVTQYEWNKFASNYSNPSLKWNSLGTVMQDNVLFVGISKRNLRTMIDRHIRGGYSEAKALKLSHSNCPFFFYEIHVFFPDSTKKSIFMNLDNLKDLTQKYLKPVIV